MEDVCVRRSDPNLRLGIRSPNKQPSRAGRLYFELRTDRSSHPVVLDGSGYKVDQWQHLVVTYDGTDAKLYVGGALVSIKTCNLGPLFHLSTSECKYVRLGGRQTTNDAFRGTMNSVILWNRTLTHQYISRISKNMAIDYPDAISESLEDQLEIWESGHYEMVIVPV